jgi:hypothetical protein
MGLQRIGEVQMYRPFEDDPLYAPTSADTEDEFEDWVEKNKEPVMQKLSLENYFNVWVSQPAFIIYFINKSKLSLA